MEYCAVGNRCTIIYDFLNVPTMLKRQPESSVNIVIAEYAP